MSENYLLFTPARDEEAFLPDVAKNITNQSVIPKLWVIGDDGSKDGTWRIIEDLEKTFPWIKGIRLKFKNERDYANNRYTEVVRKGLKYATEFCQNHSYGYQYLAVVDVDVDLEKRYFEKIIETFKVIPKIGIASGFVYEEEMSSNEIKKSNIEPRGCALVFRRNCYEMIGGFQGHTNSIIKARKRGWGAEVLWTTKVYHRRKSWYKKNYFLTAGASAYSLNYHPLNALLTGFYYFLRNSPIKGLYYLNGYIGAFVAREKKTEDTEIKKYYWNSLSRLIARILGKFS